MKIVFLVGGLGIGGGNYVIFQHAWYAQGRGHEVVVASVFPVPQGQVPWHPALREVPVRHVDEVRDEHFDIAIATWWRTAPELHRLDAGQYLYFVQSIESRFFPRSMVRMRSLVDQTYCLGMRGITEATWIKNHLKREFDADFSLVLNGIRKDLYRADGPQQAARGGDTPRVLVEGAFIPFKNTARAARIARGVAGYERWLLTPDDVRWFPGFRRVFSGLPIGEVPAVLRSCDIMLKLSMVEGMFGPPLEMFHCGGTAVVYDVTGYEEYVRHEENAVVLPMHDEDGVIDALKSLRDDRAHLARLQRGALETAAAWPDWTQSSQAFLNELEELSAQVALSRHDLAARTASLWDRFGDELEASRPQVVERVQPKSTVLARVRDVIRPHYVLASRILDGYRSVRQY